MLCVCKADDQDKICPVKRQLALAPQLTNICPVVIIIKCLDNVVFPLQELTV